MRIDENGKVYSQVSFSAHRPNEMDKFRNMERLDGFMLRYIKLLKPDLKRNYQIIPYSEIDKYNA